MKPHRYNFAAAFCEYTKGSRLEDISVALAIPLRVLKARYRDEGWSLLLPEKEALVCIESQATAERGRQRILENREKNYAIALKLQEDLGRIVEKLLDGTLKIERVFANGLRAEVEPGLRERGDLANYAKGIAELSYRALGDVESSKNAPTDPTGTGSQQIVIMLPGAVAAPRQVRGESIDVEVVGQSLESVG